MDLHEDEKTQWIEFHARKLAQMFTEWQDPNLIAPQDYAESLKRGLRDCHDDPLRKSLIESLVTVPTAKRMAADSEATCA